MKERNLVDLLVSRVARYGDRTALRVKRGGRYQNISWNEFLERVVRISEALKRAGIEKGDRVAIFSENRPEWAFADLAILALGGVVVPVYPTASFKDAEHVLVHSGASLIFVSTPDKLDFLSQLGEKISRFRKIVVFDSTHQSHGAAVSLDDFASSVTDAWEMLFQQFQNQAACIGLDDLATILYTSGTTGLPKGVMLTHRNFLINCYDAKEALPISDQDVSLSFLPLSHVFERMGGYYLHLLCGCTIAYAENMNTVPENLKEVRPTISCGVPRFFEKMYARIQDEANKSRLKKIIFNWAIRIGGRSAWYRMKGEAMPFFLNLQHGLAVRLVYRRIYHQLGGRLRCFISGSAPLARELAEFFYSIGVLILEGYGLTETSPVVSVNRWERFKFGSVGLPLKHVEVKLASDGEILVRGPSVMQGYYQNPEATREAIRDGWFYTGDFGKIDSDGFLYITGRKKDLIKTSGGKFVSPQNIESLLLADPVFSQVVLVGDKQRFVTALIVPNFEQVKLAMEEKAKTHLDERRDFSPADMVKDKRVHEFIWSRIDEHTRDLAPFEKIKYFTLLSREFSQKEGELTITLKIKRNVVAEHFKEAIERMYRETDRQDEGRDRIFFVL